MIKNLTEGDLASEDSILERLLLAGAIRSFKKLNKDDDFAHIDAQSTTRKGKDVLLELRDRSSYSEKYITARGGPFINLNKLWPSIHIARNYEMSLYFVVGYSDVIGLYDLYDVDADMYSKRCLSKPVQPRRRVNRGQNTNDSAFAIALGAPSIHI